MEIEKILFEIFKRRSLRHVVGKLIEIPEPHFSISPVSESGRCHLSQSSHSFGPVNSQDLSSEELSILILNIMGFASNAKEYVKCSKFCILTVGRSCSRTRANYPSCVTP